MTPEQIAHMVNRFLGWRLPENFNPDAGISFKAEFNENTPWPMRHEPTGTNLFDATQADAMVHHMVDGLPPSPTPTGQGTAMIPDLHDLLTRVEASTGADRELDRDIGLALAKPRGLRFDERDETWWDHSPASGGQRWSPPAYTASLDAALALVERVLPGKMKFVGDLDPTDMRAVATISEDYPDQPSWRGFAPQGQYALALLAAMLKAKIAQQEQPHG